MLIIDSREQYSNVGKDRVDSLARHVQIVRDRNIAVDVRTLQQGDVLWIAKSRCAHPSICPLCPHLAMQRQNQLLFPYK